MIDHTNLEEFQDPANYDLEEVPGSEARIAFYCDLAQETGGPVLELACGTGIVTLPIAELGLEVTGVDLAAPMLEYAHAKAEQRGVAAEWVHGDARTIDLGRSFPFIFITGNAFQAFLQRRDQEQLLANVLRHLAPGGMFVFDTRNPSGHDLSDIAEEQLWKSYTNIQGRRVTISETQHYDPLTQVIHWALYRRYDAGDDEVVKITRIACRFTHPQELEALLHYNGFVIEQQYGSWDRSPVTTGSYSLISLCRRRI